MVRLNKYALKWAIFGNLIRAKHWVLEKDPLKVMVGILSTIIVGLVILQRIGKDTTWSPNFVAEAPGCW